MGAALIMTRGVAIFRKFFPLTKGVLTNAAPAAVFRIARRRALFLKGALVLVNKEFLGDAMVDKIPGQYLLHITASIDKKVGINFCLAEGLLPASTPIGRFPDNCGNPSVTQGQKRLHLGPLGRLKVDSRPLGALDAFSQDGEFLLESVHPFQGFLLKRGMSFGHKTTYAGTQ
jgi:hypothetical protein